jgi:hypothetical protein
MDPPDTWNIPSSIVEIAADYPPILCERYGEDQETPIQTLSEMCYYSSNRRVSQLTIEKLASSCPVSMLLRSKRNRRFGGLEFPWIVVSHQEPNSTVARWSQRYEDVEDDDSDDELIFHPCVRTTLTALRSLAQAVISKHDDDACIRAVRSSMTIAGWINDGRIIVQEDISAQHIFLFLKQQCVQSFLEVAANRTLVMEISLA